jgi:hypothetical protein
VLDANKVLVGSTCMLFSINCVDELFNRPVLLRRDPLAVYGLRRTSFLPAPLPQAALREDA